MNLPNKHEPAEIFGFVPDAANKPECKRIWRHRHCPFRDSRCMKRSQHNLMPTDWPFGVCSVWHRSRHSDQAIPHIICPARFRIPQVFQDAAKALKRKGEVDILDEVQLTGIGRVDYLIASHTEHPRKILDFCAVEVMAVSTTTPHHADQTPEGVDLLNRGAVENVLAFLAGQPRNVVTLQRFPGFG